MPSGLTDANYQSQGISLYDRPDRHDGSYGFSDAIGSSTADGSWVEIEMEFDIPNSTFRYWFYADGVDSSTAKMTSTSVGYPLSSIDQINFPDNTQFSGFSPVPQAIYFDDIAISENGRIGPVSGGSVTPNIKGITGIGISVQ